jgi:hypothetical protein
MSLFAQRSNRRQQMDSVGSGRSRPSAHRDSHRLHPILERQRAVGNQTVLRLMRSRNGSSDPPLGPGFTAEPRLRSQLDGGRRNGKPVGRTPDRIAV